MQSVDAGAIARAVPDPAQIPARIHEARVAAVRAALGTQ
jgi:tRNA nucleotidyltransferase (CCA-adding enzyme)